MKKLALILFIISIAVRFMVILAISFAMNPFKVFIEFLVNPDLLFQISVFILIYQLADKR